ncbi:MAG: PKD domain-containing protein [Bacteroidota bacterium]
MKIILFVLFSLEIINISNAQPWMNPSYLNKDRKSANFYDIQKAFNKYWENKSIEKGKGWKQFKRWEDFMEPRVYPSGEFPSAILWEEFIKTRQNAKKKDTTANWTLLGPVITPTNINSGTRSGSGRINGIAFHPTDPDIYWTGSPSGGLWKTIDGGNSWITTTDDLPSIGVTDIAVHPINPDIIYIATGDADAWDTYSAGILKSTDGGLTWNTTGYSPSIAQNQVISKLIINPDNPEILIAATSDGIIKTINNGDDWIITQAGYFRDIKFNPANPAFVYAASSNKIYRSIDGADSFYEITTTGITSSEVSRIALAVTNDNPGVIYALCSNYSDDGFHSLHKSSDAGVSWTQVTGPSPLNLLGWDISGTDDGGQAWYDLALAVSPVNENEVYVGGINVWRSTNGGSSWSIKACWYGGGVEYVHADQHILAFNPLDNILYSGNDGGLYKTFNGGTTWIDISDGLEILQIYRIGASATNDKIAVTGSQDNGVMKMNDTTWNAIVGADGMECIVDYTDKNIIYAETQYGSMSKSTNGGYSFVSVTPPGAGYGSWITPYIMHPADHNTLYAGYEEVYKTTDGGDNWTTISSFSGGYSFRALALAPSDDNFIYASNYFDIWKTANGGASWTDITSVLSPYIITYITVSQTDPNKIWVTLSGFSSGKKVYMSTNGGNSWINYSTGIPNIPVNCIVYENNSYDALYIGTDLGVYYRNNSMSEWIEFTDGLPNVIVNELEIHYDSKKIRAGTYGRGLWESDIYQEPAVPTANFSYQIISNCNGLVSFSDMSPGIPDNWLWDFGDGNTSNEQNPAHNYTAFGTYSVQLIVSNSLGTDTIATNVTIATGEIISDFTTGYTSFCYAPSSVQFTNLSANAGSYLWDFGDGTTGTESDPVHTYTSDGNYNVSLIAYSTLCGNDTLIQTEYISIDTSNLIIINIPQSGISNAQTCCAGKLYDSGGNSNYQDYTNGIITIAPLNALNVTLDFISFDFEQDWDYLYIYDGPDTSGSLIGAYTGYSLPNGGTITSSGGSITIKQYSDYLINEPGFELDWTCEIEIISSISEAPELSDIKIFPDPNTGEFYIEFHSYIRQDLQLKILNITGQVIYYDLFRQFTGKNQEHIVLDNMAKGIYQLQIISETNVINKPLVVY